MQSDTSPPDQDYLAQRIAQTLGLPAGVARRLVDDVVAHYAETAQQYVVRRHRELAAQGWKNARIYQQLRDELATRPFAAPDCSVRQIRRMIYG
jgi:hypothetical protein